jgi:Protein of unknown function (DUF2815)
VETKVITPKAVLSYPHLDEPQAAMNGMGKPKYSAVLVFPAGTNLSALEAAVLEAATVKFGASAAAKLNSGTLKTPLRKDAEEKGYSPGSTFINVRTEQKPGCVYLWPGPDGKPADIPDDRIKGDLYAGAFVRASLRAFAYDTNGNKGVAFALNNIQKLGDGPRLDGRKAAADEFEADLKAAPADLSDVSVE